MDTARLKRECYFFGKHLLLLVAFALIGWLALALAYCIPSSWMTENILASGDILQKEGLQPEALTMQSLHFDNFTDARMLNEALYSANGNPLVTALSNNEYTEGGNSIERLISAAQGIASGNYNIESTSYIRYWHGFLIYLKPLLCFTDIYGLRFLFKIIFFTTLSILCFLLSRYRGGGLLVCGIILSYITFGGGEAASCLAFFPSMTIPLLGGLLVINLKSLSKQKIFSVFCLLGALINYFDFLDNPILSWGIPASLLIVRAVNQEGMPAKSIASLLLTSFLGWGFAYLFTWIAKLLLAAALIDYDPLRDAMQQATHRINGDVPWLDPQQITPSEAIIHNAIFNMFALGFATLLLTVIVAIAIKTILNMEKRIPIPVILLILAIGLMPFLWFAVLVNHSLVHVFIAHRNLILSMFALFLILYVLVFFSDAKKGS